MKYEGQLYGKIGRKYFNTGKTSHDWDSMENALKAAIVCLDTDRDLTDEEVKGTHDGIILRRATLRLCQKALSN